MVKTQGFKEILSFSGHYRVWPRPPSGMKLFSLYPWNSLRENSEPMELFET
jgi:hypothetical protein